MIKRYFTNLVIGIYFGGQKIKKKIKKFYNIATPFDVINEDIKFNYLIKKQVIVILLTSLNIKIIEIKLI